MNISTCTVIGSELADTLSAGEGCLYAVILCAGVTPGAAAEVV